MGDRPEEMDDLSNNRYAPRFPSVMVNMALMKPPSYNQYDCHGEGWTRRDAEFQRERVWPAKCREALKTKNYSIHPNPSLCLKDGLFQSCLIRQLQLTEMASPGLQSGAALFKRQMKIEEER